VRGGEDDLLRWLRRRFDLSLIGDDAAVLPAGGPFVVTVDSQIEGTHFPAGLDPAQVARRLLAVNLSDLAAMGAAPAYAFLALTAPHGFAYRRFFAALLAACAPHRLRLAGGDLSRAPAGGLAATLTLFGTRPRGGVRWLHRAGAAAGQRLWLGGTVGESAAGRLLMADGARLDAGRVTLPGGWQGDRGHPRSLAAAARRAVRRHLLPVPQLELGWWLARRSSRGRAGMGAAIDISDGLARDLHRLCAESGAGARLDAARLPFAAGFERLCTVLGADPLALALGGGEDYVLLFTLPAALAPPDHFGCQAIGTITSGRRVLITADAASASAARPLAPSGWDHLEPGVGT
jgi:thiamine-monophosphate kinase